MRVWWCSKPTQVSNYLLVYLLNPRSNVTRTRRLSSNKEMASLLFLKINFPACLSSILFSLCATELRILRREKQEGRLAWTLLPHDTRALVDLCLSLSFTHRLPLSSCPVKRPSTKLHPNIRERQAAASALHSCSFATRVASRSHFWPSCGPTFPVLPTIVSLSTLAVHPAFSFLSFHSPPLFRLHHDTNTTITR